MPYEDQSGPPPAAEGLDSSGGDAVEKETIHIQSDMLPQGIKEGDCLHCTGMDENGCQFELEKGEGPETGESWEDSFRKEMSAMSPQEGAS